MYTESDISDAEDMYGRSKHFGEVTLTLRTSIIGRELRTSSGLVEWFLSQKGKQVHGYTRAIYSGFTTLALARIIADILEHKTDMSGLYHVSSERISKYDLLVLAREVFDVPIEIQPDAEAELDRSLDSSRFRHQGDFTPAPWPAMIREMAADPTPYDEWRSTNAS